MFKNNSIGRIIPLNSKRNNRIDNIRMIMTLFVVLIHTTAFKFENNPRFINYFFYRYIFDLAVPFFFATTGYYIAKNNSAASSDRIVSTAKIFIKASIFYICWDLLRYIIYNGKYGFTKYFNFRMNRINFYEIFIGQFGSYHLWYYSALIISLTFIFLFCKDENIKALLPVSLISYIFLQSLPVNIAYKPLLSGKAQSLFYISLGVQSTLSEKGQNYKIKEQNYKIIILVKSIMSALLYTLARHYNYESVAFFLISVSTYNLIKYATLENNDKLIISSSSQLSNNIYLSRFLYRCI